MNAGLLLLLKLRLTSQPTITEIKTVIGFGSKNEDCQSSRGTFRQKIGQQPRLNMAELPCSLVPEEAAQSFAEKVRRRGAKATRLWNQLFEAVTLKRLP